MMPVENVVWPKVTPLKLISASSLAVSLRSRREAMPTENVAHRLIRQQET